MKVEIHPQQVVECLVAEADRCIMSLQLDPTEPIAAFKLSDIESSLRVIDAVNVLLRYYGAPSYTIDWNKAFVSK